MAALARIPMLSSKGIVPTLGTRMHARSGHDFRRPMHASMQADIDFQ